MAWENKIQLWGKQLQAGGRGSPWQAEGKNNTVLQNHLDADVIIAICMTGTCGSLHSMGLKGNILPWKRPKMQMVV